MTSTDSLLTLAEVAQRLGKSEDWVYRQCLAGRMPHHQFGNRRRLTEDDYAEYLKRTKKADSWQRSNVARGKRRNKQ